MLKSASLNLLTKLLTAGSNFATLILLSRYLGVAERGVCGWYLVVVAIALVFSESASGAAAGFLLQKHPINKIRFLGYRWSILTAFGVTSFFFMVHKINLQEWCWLSVLCWLNAANIIHTNLFLAKQKFLLFNTVNIIMAVGVLVSVFLFFQFGSFGREGYLYSLFLAWGSAFILGSFFFTEKEDAKMGTTTKGNLLKDGFTYGLANQASHLASLLNGRLVYFILPATVLGVYSNALSLAESLMILPGTLGQILYAAVLSKKKDDNPTVTVRNIWWICVVILLLAFLVILIVPDTFYQFVFGKEFTGVKTYLTILAAGSVFNGSYLVLSYWQSATGGFIKNFYASALGLFVNIACCFYFYFSTVFNPLVAAYSISIGFFGLFIVSAGQFCKKNGGWKSLFQLPSPADFNQFLK